MIKLSKRLEKVASKVSKNSVVLDVGTDHGLLPMYLVTSNIINKAIASDVVSSIVEKTKNAVSKNKLDDKIKVVLSDGLMDIDDKKIIKDKVDTIVIAGMGGILTCDILAKRLRYVKDKKLILSPHRDTDLVRQYLHKIGFKIVSEDIVEDRPDKFYNIIVAKKGEDNKYSSLDYKLGKKLINKKNREEDFNKYLIHEINKNKNIIVKLQKGKDTKDRNEKINVLEKEIKDYERILNR